ncbi:MAG: 50S ribosomal protein L22 [Verrucomicrobiota bacterium]
MEVKATYKFARISPLKARDVAREVTGMPVSAALDVIRFTPKKAAFLIGKTLKSAMANAENNFDLAADDLVVKSATVTEGPVFKRWKPRARGGAAPIRKRTSHINVILSNELGESPAAPVQEAEEAPKPAAKKTAAKKKAKSAATEGDDLKMISGVGPKLEAKLHEEGITTYEQILAWTEDDMVEFGERLSFKDRIQRDDWQGQVKKLIEERG